MWGIPGHAGAGACLSWVQSPNHCPLGYGESFMFRSAKLRWHSFQLASSCIHWDGEVGQPSDALAFVELGLREEARGSPTPPCPGLCSPGFPFCPQLLPSHAPPAPTHHPTVIVPAPPPSHHVTVVTMGPSSVINTVSTSRQNLDTIVQVSWGAVGGLAVAGLGVP